MLKKRADDRIAAEGAAGTAAKLVAVMAEAETSSSGGGEEGKRSYAAVAVRAMDRLRAGGDVDVDAVAAEFEATAKASARRWRP